MFNGDQPWTTVGEGTIKSFEVKAKKHVGSKTHMKNSEMFHMLGHNRIETVCLKHLEFKQYSTMKMWHEIER